MPRARLRGPGPSAEPWLLWGFLLGELQNPPRHGHPVGAGVGPEAPRGASSLTSLGFCGFISVQEPLPSPHCPGGLLSQHGPIAPASRPRAAGFKH